MVLSVTALASPFSSSKPTFSFWQTIAESLKLLKKSFSLSFPLLFLSIVTSSLLFLSNYISVAPSATDLLTKLSPFLTKRHPLPLGPELSKFLDGFFSDTKRLTAAQSPFLLADFILSLLFLIAATHTFSLAYTEKPLTVISLLKKIKNRWYQTLITQFYIILLTVGFSVITSVAIGVIMLIMGELPTVKETVSTVSIMATSLYLYFRSRWSLSQIITVVEKKETYGIGALSWAVELFVGNVCRGVMFTVLDLVVGGTIFVAHMIVLASRDKDVELKIKISAVMVAANMAWNMIMTAVYTVFYYECRKSFGLNVVEGEEPEGFMYKCLVEEKVKLGSTS